MDIEYHYYITYILARKAGMTKGDAFTIAYSSQYTDDNTHHYYINFKSGDSYLSEVSQTLDVTKPSAKRQKIYPLFHFIPGDPTSDAAKRKDGKTHILNTTPDSTNAKYFFKKAIESDNLFRIGIAAHAYADSWAHQNFVGMKHDFNAMPSWELVPNIGHADARHEPDKVHNRWKDLRLVQENELIDNDERMLAASEKIFSAFCSYHDPDIQLPLISQRWDKLRGQIQNAMDESYWLGADDRARVKAYGNICKDIPEYGENEWRYGAVEKRPLETDLFDRYWGKRNFYNSPWYKFQEAVKEHRDLGLKRLKPLYKRAGLQI